MMDIVSMSMPLSWRDPDGYVVKIQGRILRRVVTEKSAQIRMLINASWFVRFMREGLIPATSEVPPPVPFCEASDPGLWLEHEALEFPCYPHEITPLQLYDSGWLTMKIAIEAAEHGWILKDASAWNVLHSRGRPVFIDVLSFERQQAAGPWMAYGQFVRHFLLPLLLHRKLALTPPEIFLLHRDGVTPERAYQLLRGLDLVSLAAFEMIILPRLLSRSGSRKIAAEGSRSANRDPALGLALLLGAMRRLQRMLERLRPDPARSKSVWNAYEEDRQHYSGADLQAKTEFVRKHWGDGPKVLDLGCNAGEFSLLAAEVGKTVVAADADEPALSRLYLRLRGRDLPVTPVLVNIARPTPSIGWQNREVESFLNRSTAQFDCVLVLGLVHHLLVSERATVPMLVELLDKIGPTRVILEWIEPSDPKFRQLAGLNALLYKDLDCTVLEACMQQKYTMLEKLPLPCGTRVMYLWSCNTNATSAS